MNFSPIEAENNKMMGRNCLLPDLNFPPQEFEDRTTKFTWLLDLNMPPPLSFLSEDWQQEELQQHKLLFLQDMNFSPIEAKNNKMMGHNCLLQVLNFPSPEFEDRTTKFTWLLDLNMPPPLC
ncbi:hypothetical protein ACFE04_004584 [Oxalis oulophora]